MVQVSTDTLIILTDTLIILKYGAIFNMYSNNMVGTTGVGCKRTLMSHRTPILHLPVL